ncbi:MAG: carbohydrate kinase [Calditrichaeota bacterium]|nr:MAG: carbohydrate kinase [Calditrichota bacterium]
MHVVVFGEILWDLVGENKYIGGAPFNFAAHLAQMGNNVNFISSVGADQLGEAARAEMNRLNLSTNYMQITEKNPTGTVKVILSDGIPEYETATDVAWDHIAFQKESLQNCDEQSILYFGTLAQRSAMNRNTLDELVSTGNWKHIFCDLNLRQNYYDSSIIVKSLLQSTVVKMNDEEARIISRTMLHKELDRHNFSHVLCEKYNILVLIITYGSDGVYIYTPAHDDFVSANKVEVKDTIGAGDSFSAGFLHAYNHGYSLRESAVFANTIAEFVVTRSGAVPLYSPEILQKVSGITDSVI